MNFSRLKHQNSMHAVVAHMLPQLDKKKAGKFPAFLAPKQQSKDYLLVRCIQVPPKLEPLVLAAAKPITGRPAPRPVVPMLIQPSA